jgi:CDP-glucose 4,6-dehydratase
MVERLNECWGEGVPWAIDAAPTVHEANVLTLDSTRARVVLGWKPRWTLEQTLAAIVSWYKAYKRGEALKDVVLRQIAAYEAVVD